MVIAYLYIVVCWRFSIKTLITRCHRSNNCSNIIEQNVKTIRKSGFPTVHNKKMSFHTISIYIYIDDTDNRGDKEVLS